MLAAQFPVFPVIIPLLSAPLAALMPNRLLAWLLALAVSLVVFITAIFLAISVYDGTIISYAVGGWVAPYGIELRVDAFSAVMLLVVSGASTLALLTAKPSIDQDIAADRQPLFYAAWLLALAAYCGIAVAGDAFNIFVFMEISSLASYVLIANGPHRGALPATFKYLVMGTVGASFYLIGVGLLYMMTGTLNLADLSQRLMNAPHLHPVMLAAAFVTIGLALKAAIFPLHVWMPNAYAKAPSAVAVFLAASATKVMLYVLFRFDFLVFGGALALHDLHFASFLMPLALLAMIIGSAVAMREQNIKRMMGYSSVAQLGYILLGATLLSTAGLTAAVVHMFNHAMIKGGLFLAIAALVVRIGGADLKAFEGAGRRMPWTMAGFVFLGMSLVGVPLTAGFISKWVLVGAALEQGALGVALIVAILISSLMAVVYIWRVVEVAYFRAPADDLPPPREAPLVMLIPLWGMVGLNIYFGLDPQIPMELAGHAAQILMEHAK
ncbi:MULTISPECIES: monovalent cation/H+ antiporter subunit D family protein [unclassified Iodidimonas]|jgi:multicomponent Na+:H+ antiporter subunit D|uniref:monovalent cation/H+ antiporter subunit D family protein n=1 Tax=unclassified Iodidimonas TaxID=2626145 RepID=UPI002482608C|nr:MULTISPECIES: monovalent cation/H+ antiporter subunit D family protein [unclassified Iodidimonas]